MSQQGHVQALRALNHRTLQRGSVAEPPGHYEETSSEREQRELADLTGTAGHFDEAGSGGS